MLLNATLHVWGDKLLPHTITEHTGLSPLKCAEKGREIEHANGKYSIAKTGLWTFCTRDEINSNSLEAHLSFLELRTNKILCALRSDGAIEKIRISFIISELDGIASRSWSDEISSEVLAAMGRMGASLSFVVICPENNTCN